MGLQEVDQFPCILYKPRFDVIAAVCWMLAVEVSREHDAC
jgi:hypothetical protein